MSSPTPTPTRVTGASGGASAAGAPRGWLFARLWRWLNAPRADLVLTGVGFALLLPALDTGLAADDYLHAIMLDEPCPIPGFGRAPLDIFRFCDPSDFAQLFRQGIFSWWDDPAARLAFMRPLSAATHVLDHALFRLNGPLLHLHSALWALVLYLGVRALYRVLMPEPWLANLALAFYVLDDARGWLVSWVAARNAAVATALSVWALYAHHAGRRGELRSGKWLGPLLFGCALLAGEGSLAVCAYLGAYVLCLEGGSLRGRLARLWPYVVLVVLWRVVYRSYGYGVEGSSLYHDPQADPFGFARALISNGPLLLGSQFGGMWSDVSMLLFVAPKVELAVYVLTLGFLLGVLGLLWPRLATQPLARYAFVGMLGATVPAVSVTPPMDRLLSWIAVGGSLLLAQMIGPWLRDPAAFRGARRAGLGVLLGAHMLGAVFLPSRARGNLVMRDSLERAEAAIPRDASVVDKTLIYLNPPLLPYAAYMPIERAAQGVPRPALQHIIGDGLTEISVERLDAYGLRLRQREGFLCDPIARLLWSERRRFVAGERIVQSDMILTVTELTADGRPLTIEIHFARPLEDPSYLWVQWRQTRSQPFVPPAVGERVVLPAADYIRSVLGAPLPIEARYTP